MNKHATNPLLDQRTPAEINAALAQRMRTRRKKLGLTQEQLSRKADVSLGSLKRFEQSHEIALTSLVKIAIALDCEEDFEELFAQRVYTSIEEVIGSHR